MMATATQRGLPVPVLMDSSRRMTKIRGLQKKLELEQEVAKLYKMLDYEERVHEILESASRGNVRSIPGFLPPKMKDLLAELAMVEEEIGRLELEINKLQNDLNQEGKASEGLKSKQWQHGSLSIPSTFNRSQTPPKPFIKPKGTEEKRPSETRAMFFINQAIKGDYNSNGFTRNHGKLGNSISSIYDKEGLKDVGFQEKISRKSGILERPSTQKPTTRQTTPKVPHFQHLHCPSDALGTKIMEGINFH